MRARLARLREWRAQLTPASAAVLAVGAAALVVVVPGSLVFLLAEGIGTYESILSSATSPFQGTLLYSGIALGVVAGVAGYGIYRSMPTRPAREACLSGAALGVQAAVYAGLYLWMRSGDKFDVFIRQFASLDVLGPFMDEFWLAVRNTIVLAVAGQGLGMALGIVLAMLVLSPRAVVRAPARAYINFMRGTPLLVQLSAGYLGFVTGLGLPFSVYTTAIIIFGLNTAAYSAEVFRAGIQSIERGQLEAARSLGMSYLQAMRYVILPQAVRRVIPPLTNEFIILIKDTSLVAFLGLTPVERELLAWASDSYSDTFNATPFIAAVAGYLVITLPLIRLVTALERRLRSGLVGVGM